jgi:serine/threonine protein kinase
MLLNEINILKGLVCPHLIIRITLTSSKCTNSSKMRRDTTSSLSKSNSPYSRICKGGELFDEIIARNKFTERDAALLMKQVLSCVNYCHTKKIVHR